MNNTLKNIIATVSFILAFGSILLLIGIAGAVDVDQMTLSASIPRGIFLIITLILGVAGILFVEKDEDEYGRL